MEFEKLAFLTEGVNCIHKGKVMSKKPAGSGSAEPPSLVTPFAIRERGRRKGWKCKTWTVMAGFEYLLGILDNFSTKRREKEVVS